MNFTLRTLLAGAALLASVQAHALDLEGVRLVYMAPDKSANEGALPAYRRIDEPARIAQLDRWADSPTARTAMFLYRRALALAGDTSAQPEFHIAVIEDGNQPAKGYRFHDGSGWNARPQGVYIKLDPSERVFKATLLHETGHIVLALLNGGDGIPARDIAAIPHTTAALTDRGTAFNEGFAIHLETLAAQLVDDPVLAAIYHYPAVAAGQGAKRQAAYYRQSVDLMGYAQSRSRYYAVRENQFAFAPAYQGADYLRWQLDPARDFSRLRSANQLLQSEGFYASVFYSLVMRGAAAPTADAVRARQAQLLAVLADVFKAKKASGDSAFLLDVVEAWMQRYPQEAREIAELFLDLTHGVFMDKGAAALWTGHYLGALRMDMAERQNPHIEAARAAWLEKVLADRTTMRALVAPQLPVTVKAREVLLVAFEQGAPLSFDANTVDAGILSGIPGITPAECQRWIAAQPLAGKADFIARVKPSAALQKQLAWGE